jgi:hypothetical protein
MKYYITDLALTQGIVTIESDEPKEEISTVFGMTIPLEHIHESKEEAEKKAREMAREKFLFHHRMMRLFGTFKPFYYGEKR